MKRTTEDGDPFPYFRSTGTWVPREFFGSIGFVLPNGVWIYGTCAVVGFYLRVKP